MKLFLKTPTRVSYAERRKYVPPWLSEVMNAYVKRSGETKPSWPLMHARLIEHKLKARPRFTREQFELIRQKAARRTFQNAVRRRQR
ncbi:hypothetical protein HZC09_03765 [Candidatus Micrarchaeota archaeon]|nr:hypothetical protein [Candidatus Micrarchaeota archaeon]